MYLNLKFKTSVFFSAGFALRISFTTNTIEVLRSVNSYYSTFWCTVLVIGKYENNMNSIMFPKCRGK